MPRCPICCQAHRLADCDAPTEYESQELNVRLLWSHGYGWQAYTLDGDLRSNLTASAVCDWLTEKPSFGAVR